MSLPLRVQALKIPEDLRQTLRLQSIIGAIRKGTFLEHDIFRPGYLAVGQNTKMLLKPFFLKDRLLSAFVTQTLTTPLDPNLSSTPFPLFHVMATPMSGSAVPHT